MIRANWDAAFGTFDQLKKALPRLLNVLKTSYKGIPIIWRPGQFYCCRMLYFNREFKLVMTFRCRFTR